LQQKRFRQYKTLTLILGANLGNRLSNIEIATNLLKQYFGKVFIKSSVYETAAWGNTNQPHFLNQVVQFNTNYTAQEVLQIILFIEQKMGRERLIKMGPRTIDIDILFYSNEVINQPNLTIPHPYIAQRKFVLMPLAEIDAAHQHPILGKTMIQLLQACPDSLDVKKFS
jgi:2-amino-4-hydroxy-6-hydroxymethyldihydropteridine diphosphokinase